VRSILMARGGGEEVGWFGLIGGGGVEWVVVRVWLGV
jgi:hypothetical protein